MHCDVWGILHLHISVHICSVGRPTCQNGLFECLYVAIFRDYCAEEYRGRSPISKCSTVFIDEYGSQPYVSSARYVVGFVRVGDVHLLSVVFLTALSYYNRRSSSPCIHVGALHNGFHGFVICIDNRFPT